MIHNEPEKVTDWATDFDHGSQEWADDPYVIVQSLKNSGCPIAHTKRYGGVWIPLNYDMLKEIALDTKNFSSEGTIIREIKTYENDLFSKESLAPVGLMPPISSDPPFHRVARNFLNPIFSSDSIGIDDDEINKICISAVNQIKGKSGVEIMENYAKKIPYKIMAKMLGVPDHDIHMFDGWINFFMLEINNQKSKKRILQYLKYKQYWTNNINEHINNPKDDVISYLLNFKIGDEQASVDYIIGTISLLLVAGIHTVSSVIGSSLWHLATNPVDRRRLVENPDMIPTAVEEFLRVYAPLSGARIVTKDMEFHGVQMKKEDWVFMSWPAANRDEKRFVDPNNIIIDRTPNHHNSFGVGIHRCIGEHMARLEIINSIKVFLDNFPDFFLDDQQTVFWSSGQRRGPENIYLVLPV